MKGLKLSDKHGVNPSLGVCLWCGEDDGTVAILGKLKDDVEAPHRGVFSIDPCEKCQEKMDMGVTCAEAMHSEGESPQPTGRWVVLSREAADKLFSVHIEKMCWMSPKTFDMCFKNVSKEEKKC